MSRILIFLLLLCGVSSNAHAQGKSIYDADITNEPYVELTGQDFIIPDNSPYWQDVSVVRDASFRGWGELYDMNSGVKVVLESGYIFLTNLSRSFTLYAFRSELEPRRGTGQTAEFSFKLEELSTEKVLKLQWKNMGFEAGGDDEFVNYQVWLYESGLIDVRFGPMFVRSSSLISGEAVIGVLEMDANFSTIFNQAYFRGSFEFPVLDYGPIGGFSSIPDSSIVFKFIPDLASVAAKSKAGELRTAKLVHDNVSLPQNTSHISLHNVLGAEVMSEDVGAGVETVNVSMLPAGQYYLRARHTDGAYSTQYFVKR